MGGCLSRHPSYSWDEAAEMEKLERDLDWLEKAEQREARGQKSKEFWAELPRPSAKFCAQTSTDQIQAMQPEV